MKIILALCAVAISGFMSSAVAQSKPDLPPISGSGSVAYQDAVNLWLSGDDLPALQALSELAKSGNAAAQILLARIGADTKLHKHVTAKLPRKERVSLLRKPGGLSGKSWLVAAQEQEPLAGAMQQLGQIGKNPDAVRVLLDQGELYLAVNASERLLWLGKATEVTEIYKGVSQVPELAKPVIKMANKRKGEMAYVGSAKVPGDVLVDISSASPNIAIEWFGVDYNMLKNRHGYLEFVLKHLDSVESWTPLRSFCDRRCASTRDACIVSGGMFATQGAGRFPFNSPSQRLISNMVYWSSPRMDQDIIRSYSFIPDFQKDAQQTDACFVSAVSGME